MLSLVSPLKWDDFLNRQPGCELLQLNLVLCSGKHRGKQLLVSKSPFVIGRADDCDLRLGGQTVSRRHCIIRQGADRAVIIDLGSRYGTVIDKKTLGKGEGESLWHGDELRIGEWQLRVSLLNAESGEPHRKSPSKTVRLLDQLDELNAAMDAGHTTWHELGSSDKTEANETKPDEVEVPAEADASSQTEKLDAVPRTTLEMASAGSKKKLEGDPPADTQAESVAEDSKAGPTKIPEHLRPKGPADSQDAAQQALRRIFNR